MRQGGVRVLNLAGNVAVVTGGNSGIGLGMADALASAGADVCVWGRDEARNASAVERIGRHGTRAISISCDVTSEAAVIAAIAETVERLGRMDSCFANAGMPAPNAPLLKTTFDDWRLVVAANLDAAFLTLREAARQLVAQGEGGSLVAVSSVTGPVFGGPGRVAYAAAKSGVVGLVRTLAVELARHSIRTNVILPGWIVSGMFDPESRDPEVVETIRRRIPLRRWATGDKAGGRVRTCTSGAVR
jgi:NAD(P)-dependent dehydrogenase (short-subunit alcohol dehydrogenase family)